MAKGGAGAPCAQVSSAQSFARQEGPQHTFSNLQTDRADKEFATRPLAGVESEGTLTPTDQLRGDEAFAPDSLARELTRHPGKDRAKSATQTAVHCIPGLGGAC